MFISQISILTDKTSQELPFKNIPHKAIWKKNKTLQKWHMTNAAPEIDKYGYHKKMAPPKMIFHKNNIQTLQKDALIF